MSENENDVMYYIGQLSGEQARYRLAFEKLTEQMNIPYAGLSDLGDLRELIVEAIFAPERGDNGVAIHVCNEVMKDFEPKFDIGYSYEDRNLESTEDAEAFFNDLLDQIAPGAFVLITTGDLIMTTCGDHGTGWHSDTKHDCETYDPHYWYYIVPRDAWEQQREETMRRDEAWRTERMKCSNPAPTSADDGREG